MIEKNKIKAVIFDMDGTIANSESIARSVTKEFFAKKGMSLSPEEEKDVFGLNWKDLVREILNRNGMPYDQNLKNTLKEKYVRNMAKKVKPIPGIHKLLDEIKPDFRLALATNSRMREVNIICDKLSFNNYFELKFARDHVKNAKPDPEIYLKVAESFNLEPRQCVVFEDSVNGLNSARSAGMFCVAIINTHPKKLLSSADMIISSYSEVNTEIIRSIAK